MNKNDYIKEVDKITPSDELKNKIKGLESVQKPKKKTTWKTITAIAACFLVVVLSLSSIPAFFGANSADKSESQNLMVGDEGYDLFSDDAADTITDSSTSQSGSTSDGSMKSPSADRKIIKNAEIYVDTKNYSTFITAFNQKVNQLGGYIEYSTENKNYSNLRNATITTRIPAEKLDSFIGEIEAIGSVTAKTVDSRDITGSYIDTESRLTALETEEQTLLDLLKKAGSLTDVIELQSRLSQVRSEIESMKKQLAQYDDQVSYSKVNVYIDEVEREVKTEDTFFGKVKKTFMDSIYSLGNFFEEAAVNILGGFPYIALVAGVVVIVILIVKKIKKR